MKRFLCILLVLFGATTLSAQRAEVGSRAPHIGHLEWISDTPDLRGSARMVVFFHSSNEECRTYINICNALAYEFRDNLNVVVVTKEPAEQVTSMLMHDYQFFYAATDEKGALFEDFNVRHVPYAVIINRKGYIVWAGNPLNLDTKTIQNTLNI